MFKNPFGILNTIRYIAMNKIQRHLSGTYLFMRLISQHTQEHTTISDITELRVKIYGLKQNKQNIATKEGYTFLLDFRKEH